LLFSIYLFYSCRHSWFSVKAGGERCALILFVMNFFLSLSKSLNLNFLLISYSLTLQGINQVIANWRITRKNSGSKIERESGIKVERIIISVLVPYFESFSTNSSLFSLFGEQSLITVSFMRSLISYYYLLANYFLWLLLIVLKIKHFSLLLSIL
jgi:hypothetical protein